MSLLMVPVANPARSRQALKKYVQNNNRLNITSQAAFDAQFNRALKAAVEKKEFTQPKGAFSVLVPVLSSDLITDTSPGPSGPVKLAKKETSKPAAKPAVKVCHRHTSILPHRH